MSKKNKIYWMEGTTKKEIEGLLNNKGFNWLRSQRNRRFLVLCHTVLLALVATGSYYKQFKEWFGGDSLVPLFVLIAIILLVISVFSLLRVSVRGIAEAPDELLDERQRAVRNSNYRYSYIFLGYVVIAFLVVLSVGPETRPFAVGEEGDAGLVYISLLFTMASLPSMVIAWRERDI
jgi:membrane protease YdiL (CAAX protease family)